MFVGIVDIYTAVRALSLSTLQVATLICAWAASIVLITGGKNRRLFVGLLVACVGVLTMLVACRYAADTVCWLTIGKSTSLRAGPGKQYHAIGSLEQNETAYVQKICDDWICVHTEKCRGWLPLRS